MGGGRGVIPRGPVQPNEQGMMKSSPPRPAPPHRAAFPGAVHQQEWLLKHLMTPLSLLPHTTEWWLAAVSSSGQVFVTRGAGRGVTTVWCVALTARFRLATHIRFRSQSPPVVWGLCSSGRGPGALGASRVPGLAWLGLARLRLAWPAVGSSGGEGMLPGLAKVPLAKVGRHSAPASRSASAPTGHFHLAPRGLALPAASSVTGVPWPPPRHTLPLSPSGVVRKPRDPLPLPPRPP